MRSVTFWWVAGEEEYHNKTHAIFFFLLVVELALRRFMYRYFDHSLFAALQLSTDPCYHSAYMSYRTVWCYALVVFRALSINDRVHVTLYR